MIGYSCWFCGESIEALESAAIRITASGLWTEDDDPRTQEFYLHADCAVHRLKGATMKFELDIFFDLH